MVRIIFIIIPKRTVNNFPPGSCSLDRKLDQDDLKMIIAKKTQLLIRNFQVERDLLESDAAGADAINCNCKVVA